MKDLNYEKVNVAEEQIISEFKQYKIDDDYTANIYDKGEGVPILFVPVFENATFIYAAQIKYFESKYRVITYTSREFTKKPLDAEVFSNDILAILQLLGLKKVNVVAMCALAASAFLAYIKKPELFNSFFLTNAFIYKPASSLEMNFQKFIVSILPHSIAKRVLARKVALSKERKYVLPRLLKVNNFKQKLINVFLPLSKTDIRDQLCKINVPVRVITTKYDPSFPIKYTRLIHENIKQSSFTVVENLKGHFLSLLDPYYFNNELELFLNNVCKN